MGAGRTSAGTRARRLFLGASVVVSCSATLVLGLALVVGEVALPVALLGAAVAVAGLVALGLVESRRSPSSRVGLIDDDRPAAVLGAGAAGALLVAAAVDLLVLVLIPVTGGLPLSAVGAASFLLVVHVALAQAVPRVAVEPVDVVDAPPAARVEIPPGALAWRTAPEPLRSAVRTWMVLGGATFVVNLLRSAGFVDDVWFDRTFSTLVLAAFAVAAIVAFDVRGAVAELTRRAQVERRASGQPLPDASLPRYALTLRGVASAFMLLCLAGMWVVLGG